MPRCKTWSDKQWQKLLRKNGYYPTRQTGSHIMYENSEGDVIPARFKDQNKMVARRMIKEHNLKF